MSPKLDLKWRPQPLWSFRWRRVRINLGDFIARVENEAATWSLVIGNRDFYGNFNDNGFRWAQASHNQYHFPTLYPTDHLETSSIQQYHPREKPLNGNAVKITMSLSFSWRYIINRLLLFIIYRKWKLFCIIISKWNNKDLYWLKSSISPWLCGTEEFQIFF